MTGFAHATSQWYGPAAPNSLQLAWRLPEQGGRHLLRHGLIMTPPMCALRCQAGFIVDDEINRLMVNPLPFGVRLHAIFDVSIPLLWFRAGQLLLVTPGG